LSYFTLSHPNQECGECRGCNASHQSREKCAREMYAQDEMERRWLFEQDLEREAEYLNSLNTTIREEA